MWIVYDEWVGIKQQLLARIKELQAQLDALLRARPTQLTPLVRRQAELVIKQMAEQGFNVTIFQGFRSFEEQDALYAQGRTKPGAIVTNARGGYSFHNYGVAVDVVFVVNGKPSWDNSHPWGRLGRIGKLHGFEWGGDWTDFPDRPHLQLTLGHTLDDFRNNKVDYKKYV